MKVYPIFLNDLTGRRCVVFGGGAEAERKIFELVECGARVVLVAEDATSGLEDAASDQTIEWIRRTYREGDLRDAFLTIITETNPEATAPIFREAESEKVLINAMDDIPHCNFVAGSVVRRGNLVVAISTSGAAPAVAVRLRQRLEKELDLAYEALLEILADLRTPMANRYPDFQERREQWYRIVDSDVLDVVRAQGPEAGRAFISELVDLDDTIEKPG